MARIRTIKPEFQQSESMGAISRDARLLFVLLWPICDDHGRTRAASRMLASLLFPYDADAPNLIEGWLAELERVGSIQRYEVAGKSYLEILNWAENQKIDKPGQPKFPPPPRERSRPFANGREDDTNVRGWIKERKGKEDPYEEEERGREMIGLEGLRALRK